jgi:hypothetical protein
VSTLTVIPWDGKPISTPGVFSGVPIEVYHSADLCAGPSISSSGLRTIFDPTRGPMFYWIESPLNPNRVEPDEKEAFVLGRAVHHLALGERAFERFFVARPEKLNGTAWNGNRTDCRDWLQHCRDQGLTVLTPGQIEQIRGMAGLLPWQKDLEDSGLANSAVVRAGALSGLVEHTIIAQDKETGVWLKSRPDAIPLDSAEFNDLKSSASVDYASLRRTLDDYRYDMQAVLASLCLEQAAGLTFTSYAFVFVMKKPPFAVEVVELKDHDLAEAREDLGVAIRTFARCLETGRWPGPGGGRGDARFIERSSWSREAALSRRTMLELELEATQP